MATSELGSNRFARKVQRSGQIGNAWGYAAAAIGRTLAGAFGVFASFTFPWIFYAGLMINLDEIPAPAPPPGRLGPPCSRPLSSRGPVLVAACSGTARRSHWRGPRKEGTEVYFIWLKESSPFRYLYQAPQQGPVTFNNRGGESRAFPRSRTGISHFKFLLVLADPSPNPGSQRLQSPGSTPVYVSTIGESMCELYRLQGNLCSKRCISPSCTSHTEPAHAQPPGQVAKPSPPTHNRQKKRRS